MASLPALAMGSQRYQPGETSRPASRSHHGPLLTPSPSSAYSYSTDDGLTPESSASTPSSVSPSPHDAGEAQRRSSYVGIDSLQPGASADPEPALQDPRSATPSPVGSTFESKEKRKRSRVTPEQLMHLERFFATDRSPTATRRKEISDLLGMNERQTQIWFQNRRAKAKLHDGKSKGRVAEPLPEAPPDLCMGFDADLSSLIHEDEPVSIIPCTNLAIGTWRRIATAVSKHDLVAYVCETKRCITWFIHSSGHGFKMEVPFDTVVDTSFTNISPGMGLATFNLSRPPLFYLEFAAPPGADGASLRGWKSCADWTEGMQATKVLRHDLAGSAVQLAHVLRNLRCNGAGSELPLYSPPRQAEPAHTRGPPSSVPMAHHRRPSHDSLRHRAQIDSGGRQPSFAGAPLALDNPSQNTAPAATANAYPLPVDYPYPQLGHQSPQIQYSASRPPSLHAREDGLSGLYMQHGVQTIESRGMPALQSVPASLTLQYPGDYDDPDSRSVPPYDSFITEPPPTASSSSSSSLHAPYDAPSPHAPEMSFFSSQPWQSSAAASFPPAHGAAAAALGPVGSHVHSAGMPAFPFDAAGL
ncbi:hypothetical protein AcV5_008860 [Taiwanofungus camphoratus]|nr:hypothetical protein AcV5_008860 [Antrodia cinnamomea]